MLPFSFIKLSSQLLEAELILLNARSKYAASVIIFIILKIIGSTYGKGKYYARIFIPNITLLPLFAFANAGVPFAGVSSDAVLVTVSTGIILGLFFGKQLGVFGMTALVVGLGIAKKPVGATWPMLYGIALICGVGFTMSLFIGSLAFEHGGFTQGVALRIGVISGSVVSGFCGWLVLHLSLPKPHANVQ